MPTKLINIMYVLDVSVLAARATARRLFREQIEESSSDSFKLDFNGIEFASRSFMDELNMLIKDYSYPIRKVNMNRQVQQMDELVQKRKKEKSPPKNNNASSADVVTL